jgi:SAM-dependent methyltransferase
MTADAYDVVAYRSAARRSTHPMRIAVQARAFGIAAPDPATARILEVGCGDGGNLFPIAAAYPEAEVVGIDLAAEPVERGRQGARELALPNLEFVQADLLDLPDAVGGSFDYVIAHGVYSWVPRAVRDGLLALLRDRLTPDGVGFVSYNCYPGSHVRDAVREAVAWALRGDLAPAERVAAAREMLAVMAAGANAGAHGRALAEYAQVLQDRPDWLLFHDELSPICDAVYLHEFVDHARRHQLEWLFEATLASGRVTELPPAVGATLASLPDDIVAREQCIDFIRNRMFRESLLCRGPRRIDRHVRADLLHGAHAAAFVRAGVDDGTYTLRSGVTITPAHAGIARALERLGAAWPGSVALDDLATDPADRDAVLDSMLDLYSQELVDITATPVPAVHAGDRPVAAPWARWEAKRGRDAVTTLRHDPITLQDDLGRRLLTLLDGTRTREQLATELDDGPGTAGQLARALASLGELGVLTA